MKVYFIHPKNFNSPPFINLGRETPFLGKKGIQTLIHFDVGNNFITQADKKSKCKLGKRNARLQCEKHKFYTKNFFVPFHMKL